MNRDNFNKGQALLREIDLIENLLNGGFESQGWIRVKKANISQPDIYPQTHEMLREMINDPDAIKIVVSEEWTKKLLNKKKMLEKEFDKL